MCKLWTLYAKLSISWDCLGSSCVTTSRCTYTSEISAITSTFWHKFDGYLHTKTKDIEVSSSEKRGGEIMTVKMKFEEWAEPVGHRKCVFPWRQTQSFLRPVFLQSHSWRRRCLWKKNNATNEGQTSLDNVSGVYKSTFLAMKDAIQSHFLNDSTAQ